MLLLLFALFVISASAYYDGVGDQLLRTFLIFSEQPLTVEDAIDAGFNNISGSCSSQFGIKYSLGSGPTASNPTWLLYTKSGQIAGFGVRVFDAMPSNLIGQFWLPVSGQSNQFDIFVTFRENMCSNSWQSEPLGTVVRVNGQFDVPLNSSAAQDAGWYAGNCIGKMGTHWAYDLSVGSNQMTWDANTMMPIMPMYLSHDYGEIHAVLIAVPAIERIEPVGDFEGPFTRGLFCYNFCSADATPCGNFQNVKAWTTMHWLFFDPTAATCDNAVCKF